MSLYNKASLVLIPSGTKAGTVFSQKPVPAPTGVELVTNGTFDTDSNWTKDTGWTIDNGVATYDNFGTAANLRQDGIVEIGKTYILKLDTLGDVSGNFGYALGGTVTFFTDIQPNKTYEVEVVATDNDLRLRASSNFTGSIDNVSVVQVVDGDFDFTRSSYATRVNSQGLIEKERSNLLLQSNSFDTTWVNSGTITRTSGQSGYDGSNDAWLLTKGSAGAFIRQTNSQSGVYTFSVYAKADTSDWLLLDIDGSPDAFQYFDLGNGVLGASGTNVDATITSVGGSWYRCSVTGADTYTEVRIYPAEGNNNVGGTTTQLYIQDAQLEQGLVATDYIETTTAAVYEGITDNVPRLDYDGDCPSLLLEPQRSNIVPISEGVPEATGAVTKTINNGTSPEGGINSLKVQKSGTSANDRIFPINNYNATLVSGNDYTISCFVKNIDVRDNGVTTMACRISGNTLFRSGFEWDGQSLSYLATGFNSGTRSGIFVEDYGNDWWRIGFTFEADGTSGNFELDVDRRYTNDTTSIETWGWQLEQGSYATSYIPTYGTSVTRNGDFCDNAGDSTIFNNQEGVLYAEIAALNDDLTFRVIGLSDDTNSNIVKFGYRADSNAIYFEARDGNVSQAFQIAYVSDITQFHKVAIKFKENDFAMWIDGSEVKTDNLGTVPSGMTMINFDGGNGFANFLGKVKSLAYFNRALTDTELVDLTT